MVTKFSKPVHLEDLTQIKLNQAGASDVIKSRSLDKLKTYLHYQTVYGHLTSQDGNLL